MKKRPCFILARKNSKGLKNKNIRLLGDKPLIAHSIEHALNEKIVSHVCVSTDDPNVADISDSYGCFTIFPRPRRYSGDNAKTEPALKHALDVYEKKFGLADICFYIQCTEPFRPKNILKKCYDEMMEHDCDSAFAASVIHKNFYSIINKKLHLLNSKLDLRQPRQKKRPLYREDTGIGMATMPKNIKNDKRLGKNKRPVVYDHIGQLIDIHTENDLKLAELVYKNY